MIFGDPRVPFTRPASSTPGYVPRSMDAGFIPTDVGAAMPQILLPQFVRLPAGVHQPVSAEPGSLPAQAPGAVETAVASVTAQPPSATAIKQRSMRMMSPALVMALGIIPPPRAGNVRSGLNPNAFINKGRNPGV
jgi:hypothetical protein